jgi:glycosyltransferase involved in cell wall biosynthesis
MRPLVSILIPAFNAERWVAQAIESARAQTWPHKEIVVVNDGSTDGTATVLERFGQLGVKVVHQENQGAAAARNKAYASCNGDFIQWLDADDLLAPDKVSRQIEALQQRGSDLHLLSSEFAMFLHRPGRAQFEATALWSDLSPKEWLLRKMELSLHMQTATWLISRKLSELTGPWDTTLLGDDDGEYFCRALIKSAGTIFAAGAKVFYRMPGRGSLSYVHQSRRKLLAQLRSMESHVQYARSLGEDARTRRACVRYLQSWFGEFYYDAPDLAARLQALAVELGGALQPATLSWKYRFIRSLTGTIQARRAQVLLPRVKWEVLRALDGAMLSLENLRVTKQRQGPVPVGGAQNSGFSVSK